MIPPLRDATGVLIVVMTFTNGAVGGSCCVLCASMAAGDRGACLREVVAVVVVGR